MSNGVDWEKELEMQAGVLKKMRKFEEQSLEGRPYPNEHACRLEDPKQFDEFRRVECDQKSDSKCIDVIYGITGTGKNRKSKIQALRYKKSVWSAADARSHCKSRKGTFEAAKKSERVKMSNDQLFYRSMELDERALDEEKREIEASFSSETMEVRRWFGIEILSHLPDAMKLGPLKRTGAHLFNHDPNHIIGPVKNARNDNGIGRVVLGYDETDEGNLALIRTKNKSLRGISTGYLPKKMKKLEIGEEIQLATRKVKGIEDIDTYIVTEWEPREISSTPIPWDTSIGLGRELTRSLDGIEIEKSDIGEGEDMTNEEVKAIFREMLPEFVPELAKQLKDIISEESKPKFRVTAEECRDLLGQAGAISPEAKAATADMMAEGKTAAEIQRELVQMATVKPDGDQTDKGTSDDPTQTRGGGMTADKIDDETFARAICDPSEMPMD